MHFVNHSTRNTRISRAEFNLSTMNEHVIANVYLDLSFLLRIMFVKNTLKRYKLMLINVNLNADVNILVLLNL